MGYGGQRQNAGRKKNTVPKFHHNIAFTNDDWRMIKQSSKSERKIADFIVEAVKFYNEYKDKIQ